jgi:glycyl-tRNA synthetase beta chain
MVAFLLEVGTEELPASFVTDAIAQWQRIIPTSLSDRHLSFSQVNVYATPRRLAVLVEGLPVQQPDQALEVKGPALAAAFANGDVNGAPTKAVLGFAKSKGVEVADLIVQSTDKGAFVFAHQTILGRPSAEILAELAPQWITGLEGKRLMRWGSGEFRFPRPIRWLVALLDEKILPIALENCTSDRITKGHRVMHPRPVVIDTAVDYVATLREAFVMVDVAERRQRICVQINGVTELISAKAEVPEALIEEVTQLVEWPTAIVGEFDREFLQLPDPVIKTEMVSHQRYFPIYAGDDSGQLLPYFITISNGDPDKSKLIAAGNGRVIRARLSDGKFFYDSDRSVPLESFLPQLQKVTFQEQLGSVAAKVSRIRAIAQAAITAIPNLTASDADQQQVDRTAQLCKADLVSQMVKEFPELQGIMGQYYARSSGEDELVAEGILEHYLPRGAGDRLAQTLPGKIVGISDRIDTLVGIFGLGIIPTGSSDPFALRRAATGIVQTVWDSDYALNIPQLLQAAIAIYRQAEVALTISDIQILENLYKWFEQRIRTLLQDRGIDYDLVDAVFGVDDLDYTFAALSDLSRTRDRALFLQQIRQDTTLGEIYEVVNRATRLAAQGELAPTVTDIRSVVQADKLVAPAETALYEAIAALPKQPNYEELVASIKAIAPILAKFFDDVLVMDENLEVRRDRLNMLGVLRNYSRILADFSAMRS